MWLAHRCLNYCLRPGYVYWYIISLHFVSFDFRMVVCRFAMLPLKGLCTPTVRYVIVWNWHHLVKCFVWFASLQIAIGSSFRLLTSGCQLTFWYQSKYRNLNCTSPLHMYLLRFYCVVCKFFWIIKIVIMLRVIRFCSIINEWLNDWMVNSDEVFPNQMKMNQVEFITAT